MTEGKIKTEANESYFRLSSQKFTLWNIYILCHQALLQAHDEVLKDSTGEGVSQYQPENSPGFNSRQTEDSVADRPEKLTRVRLVQFHKQLNEPMVSKLWIPVRIADPLFLWGREKTWSPRRLVKGGIIYLGLTNKSFLLCFPKRILNVSEKPFCFQQQKVVLTALKIPFRPFDMQKDCPTLLIKCVCLQGITLKLNEERRCIVARIMHGGMIHRQGLCLLWSGNPKTLLPVEKF